jgi:hypothetical protein
MKAKFIGYQEDATGTYFALYNIIGGERDNSSVTERTLIREGIEVPMKPTLEEWLECKNRTSQATNTELIKIFAYSQRERKAFMLDACISEMRRRRQ